MKRIPTAIRTGVVAVCLALMLATSFGSAEEYGFVRDGDDGLTRPEDFAIKQGDKVIWRPSGEADSGIGGFGRPGEDVDGDGIADAIVWRWSGGAHCCNSIDLIRLAPSAKVTDTIALGNGDIYSVRFGRPMGSSAPLLAGWSDLFAYRMAEGTYAGAQFIPLVWQWRNGRASPSPMIHVRPLDEILSRYCPDPSRPCTPLEAEEAAPEDFEGVRLGLFIDLVMSGHASLASRLHGNLHPPINFSSTEQDAIPQGGLLEMLKEDGRISRIISWESPSVSRGVRQEKSRNGEALLFNGKAVVGREKQRISWNASCNGKMGGLRVTAAKNRIIRQVTESCITGVWAIDLDNDGLEELIWDERISTEDKLATQRTIRRLRGPQAGAESNFIVYERPLALDNGRASDRRAWVVPASAAPGAELRLLQIAEQWDGTQSRDDDEEGPPGPLGIGRDHWMADEYYEMTGFAAPSRNRVQHALDDPKPLVWK